MIPVSFWFVRILWLCSAAMMAPGCVSLVHWLAPLLPLLILAACGILELPYPTKGISAALKVQLQELAQHPFRMLESCHGIPFSAQDPDIFRAFAPNTERMVLVGHWFPWFLAQKINHQQHSGQKVAIENIPGVGKATVDYLNRQYPYTVAIGVGVTFGLVTDLRWSRSVAGADPSLHRWGFKLCQSPNLPICWWRWWAPGEHAFRFWLVLWNIFYFSIQLGL